MAEYLQKKKVKYFYCASLYVPIYYYVFTFDNKLSLYKY